MNKTFEITAKLLGRVADGAKSIRISWRTQANDMREAITKAGTYIRMAEVEEQANCVWINVGEEVQDA